MRAFILETLCVLGRLAVCRLAGVASGGMPISFVTEGPLGVSV